MLHSFATALLAVTLCTTSLADSFARRPLQQATTVEDPIVKTTYNRAHSHSNFDLTFVIGDTRQTVRLALEPNLDLIPDSFTVTRIGADGVPRQAEPINRQDHKVYKGETFVERNGRGGWSSAGMARITVHRDGRDPIFEGSFRINGNTHHIQTAKHYHALKHSEDPEVAPPVGGKDYMVIWRDSDVRQEYWDRQDLKRDTAGQLRCESEDLAFNAHFNPEERDDGILARMDPRALFGRQSIDGGTSDREELGQNLAGTIGSTDGCPTTRKVALLGIATDCTYYKDFETEEDLRKNVISMVNQASELYESTFKISLGLQNLVISERDCPSTAPDTAPWNIDCGNNVSINDRLNLFSQWRGKSEDTNAYWTLLTTCHTSTAVGLAWRGQICRQGSAPNPGGESENETVASTNVVVRRPEEWQIFAHETGHTFGAVHDCTVEECPQRGGMQICCPLSRSACNAGGKFIMNPSTRDNIDGFSPCSIGNICSALRNNVRADCLSDNRDVDIITGSQCGNGIVESGEECDCGTAEECESNCCNPETCKYRSGGVCDPTNESCCTDQCQFASAGSVCRASTGECDPEEICPGDVAQCPTDDHLDDGQSCGDEDGLKCASGQCTSRDMQCRSRVGDLATNNDTKACNDDSCMLSCESPDFGGQCRGQSSNFIDGTPCGSGGKCSNGVCDGSSVLNAALQWAQDNKHILIPVGASVGGLIVIAILWCIIKRIIRSRRAKRKAAKPPVPGNNWPAVHGANITPGGYYPSPMQQSQRGYSPPQHQQQSGYFSPAPSGNHSGHFSPNQPQASAESPNYNTWSPQQGRWQRTQSVRYA